MPKYRALHVKILDSQDFSDIPDDFSRVVWMLFIVALDSEGRGIDNPAWIRSKLFPYRTNVNIEDIEKSMSWFAARGMINRYQVNGRRYFEIPTFKDYQPGIEKEARSVLPANPNLLQSNSEVTPELVETNSTTTASVYESAYESESVSAYAKTAKAAKNAFALYEQEIGPITPFIADAIGDELDSKTPYDWIKRAIEIAAQNNARSWAYIAAILKNWKEHGFEDKRKKSNNGKQPAVKIDWSTCPTCGRQLPDGSECPICAAEETEEDD